MSISLVWGLAYILSSSGFAAIVMTMTKHQKSIFGSTLRNKNMLKYTIAGWTFIAFSLWLFLQISDIGRALNNWAGLLTMFALTVALLLTFQPKLIRFLFWLP